MVEIADHRATWDKANTDILVSVTFEDLEDDTGVVCSASTPRLSRLQVVSPEFFTRKAHVELRQPATVAAALRNELVSPLCIRYGEAK
jgi:hypothetical protein